MKHEISLSATSRTSFKPVPDNKEKIAELKVKIKETQVKLKELDKKHKEKIAILTKSHTSSKEMKAHTAAIKQAEKDNDLRAWRAATKNHDATVKSHVGKIATLTAKQDAAKDMLFRKIKI